MSKPVLGYWDIRGYAEPHRLLLTYLGVDFEDKRYSFGNPAEPTIESWLADKTNLGLDFPNLPYWIDRDTKLTESKAILRYLAKAKDGGKLYPQTTELQAVADMVEGLVTDLQRVLVMLAHSPTGIPATPLEEAQAPKFTELENFLAKRQWTVGENISFVDFYVYEVLKEYYKFNPDFLKPYPTLTSYVEKFEALPQLGNYIKAGEKFMCWSPYAKLKF